MILRDTMECYLVITTGKGRYRHVRSFRNAGRATLAMIEAVRTLRPGWDVDLQVRNRGEYPEEVVPTT